MTIATKSLLITLAVLAAAFAALAYVVPDFSAPQPVVCTAEAKMCPDGSYVGRAGPDCEFALCPSEASCEGGVCPAATSTAEPTPTPTPKPTPKPTPNPVACTMEAKLCPDGSYVGRTGPKCEFAPCPTSTGGGILPYRSGIRGTIMVGPTCPVERMPPDPKCADKPLKTNVSIYRASNTTKSIATLSSAADGTFEVSLPPGEYVVMAGPYGVPMPRCSDTAATVGAMGYTQITVSCDSGIR